MATYAISDIHGAYEEFVRLLQKINFRYDGSDTLYLLGDYIDWGPEPLKTLLLVKELDEHFDFVHVVMGNHELMFLQTLDSGYDGVHPNDTSDNWLYTNHGLHTWLEFLTLPDEEEEDVVRWLRQLRLSFTTRAGGRTWMLAHAYPYYYDVPYTPEEQRAHVTDAVWHRMQLFENPFAQYRGTISYDGLVCGHTISDAYYQDLYRMRCTGQTAFHPIYDRNSLLGPLTDTSSQLLSSSRNRIFYGEKFIDIDCGAKCLAMDPSRSETAYAAVYRAQLSALRLDDMAEFYVRHSEFQSSVSQMNDMAQSARETITRYMRAAQVQLFGTAQK